MFRGAGHPPRSETVQRAYQLEVHLDGSPRPEFEAESTDPYPVPNVGDYLHPAWRLAGHTSDYYVGDRHKAVRVEHVIWDGSHKLLVFCSDAPRPP